MGEFDSANRRYHISIMLAVLSVFYCGVAYKDFIGTLKNWMNAPAPQIVSVNEPGMGKKEIVVPDTASLQKRISDIKIEGSPDLSDLVIPSFASGSEKTDFINQQVGIFPVYADKEKGVPAEGTNSNGIILSPKGYVLACSHAFSKVADYALKDFYMVVQGGFVVQLDPIAYSKESDLALLRVKERNKAWAHYAKKENIRLVSLSASKEEATMVSLLPKTLEKYGGFMHGVSAKGMRGGFTKQEIHLFEEYDGGFLIDGNLFNHPALIAKGFDAKKGQSGSPAYSPLGNLVGILCSETEGESTYFVPAKVIQQFVSQCRVN